MAKTCFNLVLLALLAVGCAATPRAELPKSSAIGSAQVVEPRAATPVRPVDYEVPTSPTLAQPDSVAEPVAKPVVVEPQPLPSPTGLSLTVVEELALANSPPVAQAEARLRSLRGKWLQVGLPPNPTVGYLASEIGADGSAGQQGGFAGQKFITAKKLQRNRAIVCAEISEAEQQLAVVVQRVQTDVRLRYYNALLAQQRVQLANELVHFAAEAVEASKSLIEAEEIPLAGLLQTEVQLQNAMLLLQTSENGNKQAWRQIQTLLGSEWFSPQVLEGDISSLPEILNYDDQLAQVQLASPEVAVAMAKVARSRRVLQRACVEAVPNINTQVSVQHDETTGDTLTGVQVSIPLPLWNRNQGGIRQARAEITQAARNVERIELHLQQRLADAFRQYSDSRITVETYAEEILTRAERTLDLVQQGYAQGEVGYLDLLTAQRTFSRTNLAYLDALGNLWQSYLRIEGLLLEGSLETSIQ